MAPDWNEQKPVVNTGEREGEQDSRTNQDQVRS